MTLAQRLALLLEQPDLTPAQQRHLGVIRRELTKAEGKLVRVSGNRDFRPKEANAA